MLLKGNSDAVSYKIQLCSCARSVRYLKGSNGIANESHHGTHFTHRMFLREFQKVGNRNMQIDLSGCQTFMAQ